MVKPNPKPVEIDDETYRMLSQAAEDYKPRQPWTRREDAILKHFYGKVPPGVMCEVLEGRSLDAIQRRARVIGVARRR